MPNGTGPSETQLAERVAEFSWDGGQLEPGIALAMSGGGFRAMLFYAGALGAAERVLSMPNYYGRFQSRR